VRAAIGSAVLALSLAGCGESSSVAPVEQGSSARDAGDPGAQPWERVARDEVASVCGLDPELLEAADAELSATPYTIVRYGRLCWVGGYPSGTDTPYPVWSETKTFGAVLFGMVAMRSGTLDDTDGVTEWIPPEELGAINPAATLAHVLAMTSTSPDLSPGNKTAWSYDTTGDREINRLVGVMNRAIALEPQAFPGVANVKDFAEKELLAPLGMTQTTWPGEVIGSSLESTVEDMSRLMLLMLRKGHWNGRQLLDESYLYRATHPAFEDTNTGYGYLTQMNAEKNWTYSTGTADLECMPYTTWPSYPHAPFYESADDNGGSPFDGGHDIGVFWAAGTGGQKASVHRGLDLVIAVRDDAVDPGSDAGGGEGAFEGHKRVWRLIRPALLALDPVYADDEAGFCAAYQRSEYAPALLSAWPPEASQ
jgi:CubicO group peptidase (beta-lactamase class C family)